MAVWFSAPASRQSSFPPAPVRFPSVLGKRIGLPKHLWDKGLGKIVSEPLRHPRNLPERQPGRCHFGSPLGFALLFVFSAVDRSCGGADWTPEGRISIKVQSQSTRCVPKCLIATTQ